MKINGEARLLLIMGLAVLLGGGAMVLVNKAPSMAPSATPTPLPPLTWTAATFDPLVTQARHVRGAMKSPRITVVEFGDLECPSCRRAYNSLLIKLDKAVPMKFAFHHFPLSMHRQAMPAAIATEAAEAQGKFWPMFDALYAGQDAVLSQDYFDEQAKNLGLDMAKFKKDSANPEIAATVTTDQELGANAHISMTPTFIVRDEKTGAVSVVTGGTDLDKLVSKITGKPRIMPDDAK